VREQFRDPATGKRYVFGEEYEFAPQEVEMDAILRRALMFGRLEKVR
jgi:hypothetical protein